MYSSQTQENLLPALQTIVATTKERGRALLAVADKLKQFGNYRWVGLYDVDHAAGLE